jgi:hypothetical protein
MTRDFWGDYVLETVQRFPVLVQLKWKAIHGVQELRLVVPLSVMHHAHAGR